LHLAVFGLEIGNPLLEGIHRHIVYLFSILGQDPNRGHLGLAFSGIVEQGDEIQEHAIEVVFGRVLSEDVLHCLSYMNVTIRSSLMSC
jgi:hypothetical protein